MIFARAISDYVNVYDPTGLSFKTGETITVSYALLNLRICEDLKVRSERAVLQFLS